MASERLQSPVSRAESSHQGMQAFVDSSPSTLSLDEPLLCNTENAAEPIIVLDDDDDQAQAATSRPQRTNRRQLDYSYPDYKHLMDAVAARNPSRKRKKQKNSDGPSLESILDQFSQDVRDQGQSWINEIKNLRSALRLVYEENEDLKRKVHGSEDKLCATEQELRASNEQAQKLQQALDKWKNLKYLLCRSCLGSKEYWCILGCGHIYCTTCISDMNAVEPLFNSHCPECREPIDSCRRFYPELMEHDN